VAGPGFLNVRVAAGAQGAIAADVVRAGDTYGTSDENAGRSVNLEFISANPTGPLHLGHARWAAVGDAIARVLEATGASVAREFYINDRGGQMEKFGASLMARAHDQEPPEDGYHGAYVRELADRVVAHTPIVLEQPDDDQVAMFREVGYQIQLADQRAELDELRTHFDVWFSEHSLHESDAIEHGFARLREEGHLFEDGGATWMRTTDFGDDKDRVLVRSDGELTYFASDTAYYVNKRERGFDPCIYLLGADHHGYVGRLSAMAACVGDTPGEQLQVLIGQLVKFMQDGKELKLSKRAGTIITLRELIDLIGVDPLRYTLIRYPVDSPLTLDVAEMTARNNDNPVYYVQYAHARLASILRNAADLDVVVDLDAFDPAQLATDREGKLLRALAEYPRVVARAAELREPHRVARYLEETASTFHKFYDTCRVLPQGDEDTTEQHRARLVLVAATRQVLANGLELLGVTAPERM
jgi:arginyl-tRNA synthetase